MKLLKIKLENFQGILNHSDIQIKNFTLLVGRNDVGKSTILKALDIFLNGITPTVETRNASSGNAVIAIELAFDASTTDIVIDDATPTSFSNEMLLDEAGLLRVRKVWDTSAVRPAAKVFIRRSSFGEADFLLLTERELINQCERLGIDTRKGNGEDFNNVEKRSKIRTELNDRNTAVTYEWLPLPTTGTGRTKIIYDQIKQLLPPFQYFKADTSLSESDAAIQKYFRLLTNTALSDGSMEDIEANIKTVLLSVLNKISQKINEVVPESDRIEPNLEFDWSKAITTSFRTKGDATDIPLSQRGDGFRRITMMAYFEHLADQDAGEDGRIIFGFEEPETFLHPFAQEQLFEKLEALTESHHQVILTSHSPIIVARSKKEYLIHAAKAGGITSYLDNVQNLEAIANDLGIRVDNQFIDLFDKAKCLLLVEGIDDAVAFNHVADLYKANGDIRETFEDLSIVILPIGGCGSIQHWVQLDLLKKLSKPFFIFLDSDKNSINEVSPNATALNELGFVIGQDCNVSRKRSLENYISPDFLNVQVPTANLNYSDFDNVKNICKQHALAGRLGGKNVANKFFRQQSYAELKTSFNAFGDDEFLDLYTKVKNLLPA